MAQPFEATFGVKKYKVEPLTIRKSKEWRAALGAPIDDVVKVLSGYTGVRINDPAALGDVIKTATDPIRNAPDLALDLVCKYSPAIAADREWIEDNAYDDDTFTALLAILEIAYPLGGVVKLIRSAMAAVPENAGGQSSQNGRTVQQTQTSLP